MANLKDLIVNGTSRFLGKLLLGQSGSIASGDNAAISGDVANTALEKKENFNYGQFYCTSYTGDGKKFFLLATATIDCSPSIWHVDQRFVCNYFCNADSISYYEFRLMALGTSGALTGATIAPENYNIPGAMDSAYDTVIKDTGIKVTYSLDTTAKTITFRIYFNSAVGGNSLPSICSLRALSSQYNTTMNNGGSNWTFYKSTGTNTDYCISSFEGNEITSKSYINMYNAAEYSKYDWNGNQIDTYYLPRAETLAYTNTQSGTTSESVTTEYDLTSRTTMPRMIQLNKSGGYSSVKFYFPSLANQVVYVWLNITSTYTTTYLYQSDKSTTITYASLNTSGNSGTTSLHMILSSDSSGKWTAARLYN